MHPYFDIPTSSHHPVGPPRSYLLFLPTPPPQLLLHIALKLPVQRYHHPPPPPQRRDRTLPGIPVFRRSIGGRTPAGGDRFACVELVRWGGWVGEPRDNIVPHGVPVVGVRPCGGQCFECTLSDGGKSTPCREGGVAPGTAGPTGHSMARPGAPARWHPGLGGASEPRGSIKCTAHAATPGTAGPETQL
eukprot:761769-Hanusia_phi.AAC.4